MHRHCCYYRHCCYTARAPSSDDRGEDDPLTVSIGLPHRSTVVVRTTGEIDMMTAPDWEEALREAVDLVAPDPAAPAAPSEPRPEVLCDLDAIRFFAVAGVSVLTAVDEYARAAGVSMIVVATTGPCGPMLDLTGVGRDLHQRRSLSDSSAVTSVPTPASSRQGTRRRPAA